MQPLIKTFEQQSRLANFCRTGEFETLENVIEKNLPYYRRLVFNVVEDMLRTAYPLTFELLGKKEWLKITEEFFACHACTSPQVWYMPKEFFEYLSQRKDHPLHKQYSFLTELLWFEWLEVEMYMMEDKTTDYSPTGNIATDALIVNPETHLQHFYYPVHLTNAREISEGDKADYFLSLHRDPDNGEIIFTSLSAALLRCLELLAETPMNISIMTNTVCKELNIQPSKEINEMVQSFILNALDTKLILGYKQ